VLLHGSFMKAKKAFLNFFVLLPPLLLLFLLVCVCMCEDYKFIQQLFSRSIADLQS